MVEWLFKTLICKIVLNCAIVMLLTMKTRHREKKQFPEEHTVTLCNAFVNGHATFCKYECTLDTM